MALLSDIIHICISAKNVLWNDTDNFLRYLFIKILKLFYLQNMYYPTNL